MVQLVELLLHAVQHKGSSSRVAEAGEEADELGLEDGVVGEAGLDGEGEDPVELLHARAELEEGEGGVGVAEVEGGGGWSGGGTDGAGVGGKKRGRGMGV